MKKILTTLMFVASMVLVGCSKSDNDDKGKSDNSPLVGKWEVLREEVKDNANSEWRTFSTYQPSEYVWVFTKTQYSMYGSDWGEDWEDNMSEYRYNEESKTIFLQLAYPNLKVYKLTETEFEVEEPSLEFHECKLVMKRIE